MASSHLFRLGSIVGNNGVLVAMRHNKRTPQTAHGANIDATRTPLNYSLYSPASGDTPEMIARYAKSQMALAGIEKPRINGVMAVECIFSLPIDRHTQDTKPFFNACHEWVKQSFAGELLSFDVHLDESAPHAHAVILPLIDGKMQGDKLKGNRDNVNRLNSSFIDEVAVHYGLSRGARTRLNASDVQTLEKLVLTRLKSDPAILSDVWACIRDAIHKDPLPFAEMLSIELPLATPKKTKSFVEIMTSKGKGKNINPIGNYA
jgi:hypothetical protein